MAHGILCKHCGWSESAHVDPSGLEWDVPREGYKITLQYCSRGGSKAPGFTPDNPELAKKLQEENPIPFGII